MKKYIFLSVILITCFTLGTQAQPKTASDKTQYLLIIRFKTDFKPSSNDVVQTNIKHWQEYMGGLAQAGSLVGGYRPANDGLTIKGNTKSFESTPYMANGKMVSSILIINAESLDAAKAIADKCPVFELGGSVEVRPVIDMAGK